MPNIKSNLSSAGVEPICQHDPFDKKKEKENDVI